MRFSLIKFLFGLFLILVFNSCSSSKDEQNFSLDLSKNWTFYQNDSILDTLDFPFSLIDALYEVQEIQDPNYEDELEDIKSYIQPLQYSLVNVFNVTDQEFKNKDILLKLGRIAGSADIYLNDSFLLNSDSYYTRKDFDISGELRVGANTLKIRFKNPTDFKAFPKYYQGNDQHIAFMNLECKEAFSIEFIKSSIYEKPYIDFAKFENDTLLAYWNIPVFSKKEQELTFEWEFEGVTYRQKMKVGKGETLHSVYFPIVKPKYWFPYTHGNQFMYSGQLSVFDEDDLLQSDSLSFAVKHLKWKNNKNQIEFVLNGESIEVFSIDFNAKNWYKTNTLEETQRYIDDLKTIGINCVRVLGNDDYLSSETLDLFDKSGMMIWQDLHINTLPKVWNIQNKLSIQSDLIDLMKQYRNHPSVLSLGGKSEDRSDNSEKAGLIHYEIFEQVIPEVVNTFSHMEYIPNSSYVWNDMKKGLEMNSMSSYNFRNVWMREKNTDPWQNAWLSKQSSSEKAEKFYASVEKRRGEAADLQGMIYHSELNQAQYMDSVLAVKRGLNAKTIHLPITYSEKGPGVHASITDFFGEKKALYYDLIKDQESQTIVKSEKEGVLSYLIRNNTSKDWNSGVNIKIRNTNGEVIDELKQQISLSSFQTKPILEWNEAIIPAIWKNKTEAKILEISFDNKMERFILHFDKNEVEYSDCKYRVISNENEEYIELLAQNYMPYTKFTTGNLGVFTSNFVTCLPNDTLKIFFNSFDNTSPLRTENVQFYDYSLSFE